MAAELMSSTVSSSLSLTARTNAKNATTLCWDSVEFRYLAHLDGLGSARQEDGDQGRRGEPNVASPRPHCGTRCERAKTRGGRPVRGTPSDPRRRLRRTG